MKKIVVCVLLTVIILSQGYNDDPSFVTEQIIQNIPMNGTLSAGETAEFVLKEAKDWRYLVFGFRMDSNDAAFGEKIGIASYRCGSIRVDHPLENRMAATRYHDPSYCDELTYVSLKNTHNKEVHYWNIIATTDSYMYDLVNGVDKSSVVPGHSTFEYVSFRGYIGKDDVSGGSVDVVNITVKYDTTSATQLKAFVSDNDRPDVAHPTRLRQESGMLVYSMSRTDTLFCTDCYLYVAIMVEVPKNEPVFFSVNFLVDRGIVTLKADEMFTGTVMPDAHGQHFMIDLRHMEVDTRVYIGLQKLDEPDVELNVDLALTSFDDGEWDTIKSIKLLSTGLREWGISNTEKGFKVGAAYYLRVMSADDVTKPCQFTVVYRLTRVQFNYLYFGTSASHQTRQEELSIAYYKINIPKEEFVDVQTLSIHMTNITYTWNQGPVYPFSFEAYFGKQSNSVTIFNPADPATYTFKDLVEVSRTYDVMITEDQIGWCTNCVFGFSLRTEHKSSWIITAELGFAPFIIEPNKPRDGSLMPYSGGIRTYFVHQQKEYREVEIAVVRKNKKDPNVVLYVSTAPNPSKTNSMWTDSTEADGRADIEIKRDDVYFCTNCKYYIGVYYVEDQDGYDTAISIEVNCPDNMCVQCKEGFDPATECSQCLPGYFGKDCKQCKQCNHGKCSDGKDGTGVCNCESGWGPDDKCNSCMAGFWGVNCMACESCHDHGKCMDGIQGNGSCACDEKFDANQRCQDCIPSFWGPSCSGECPKSAGETCSKHGTCFDGINGKGYCNCNEGMVGLKCDTKKEDDRCNPVCVINHGGCNEDTAVCVCYDKYKGVDCASEGNNVWVTVSICCMAVILIILLTIVFIKMPRVSVKQRKTRKNQKDPLLENGDESYSGIH